MVERYGARKGSKQLPPAGHVEVELSNFREESRKFYKADVRIRVINERGSPIWPMRFDDSLAGGRDAT